MSTATGCITGWTLSAPDDWVTLPASFDDVTDTLLAEATTSDDAARYLREYVRATLPALASDDPLLVALWVPDPELGAPMAVLRAVHYRNADPDVYEQMVANAETDEGGSLLGVERTDGEVDAGRLLVMERQEAWANGTVEHQLHLGVFPEGTDEAVVLVFICTALHRIDELALIARDITDTMRLRIEEEAS
ncbi:hypothetical protein [Nocardioides acrostichi]|uniref:Uncharacterized protein n=1 Tax=Nocardioides acrostichi TaxID=2784339 RepID=A0A930UWJ9_9ACTN|nr:hypothetical protein [Nocardioides acrostichi]MBF4161471.1 hypothetical protein [Nocardioides acrostichi]